MAGRSLHAMEAGIHMNSATKRIKDLLKSTKKLAPYMAICFLATAGMIETGQSEPPESLSRYHDDIAEQVSLFPYQIGKWVGRDVSIATSAQKILRPNGLISRRFSRSGDDGALTFALIHCIDLPDMYGHHPPRCYPASGWSFDDQCFGESNHDQETIEVPIAGVLSEMAVYRFIQGGQIGSGNRLVVVSMFMTPLVGMVNDMATLQETGALDRGASSLGIAQIQLVFDGEMAPDKLRMMVSDFMANMPRELIDNILSIPETEEFKGLRKNMFDESDRS